MTVSTSSLSYDDIFELFDRADADGHGVRVVFDKYENLTDNRGDAFQLRIRINYARKIDRANNAKLYPKDHPLHGRSKYDIYSASIRDVGNEAHLYLEKRNLNRLKIEDLSQGAVE